MRQHESLARLGAAAKALAGAKTLDEVKGIRDMAEAARVYAQAAEMGLEVQNDAAEIKLRAERKAGEILANMAVAPRNQHTGPALADMGIEKTQSHRWQRIATVPEAAFEEFVSDTREAHHELTTAGALRLAKVSTNGRPVSSSKPLTGEYRTIVADPPWQYDNRGTRGAATDHYPTMTLEDIAALEIPAATDAHLYLWTTNSFLRPAFDIVEAWGFAYKTCLTWVKPQIGLGNYFRNATEHVLFGVRGKLGTLVNDQATHFEASRGKHSAKPDLFLDIVETASPGPYLEMFARRRRMGWDVWGAEA